MPDMDEREKVRPDIRTVMTVVVTIGRDEVTNDWHYRIGQDWSAFTFKNMYEAKKYAVTALKSEFIYSDKQMRLTAKELKQLINQSVKHALSFFQ